MKKVYICHQYYEPSHFKALYDCAQDYGYQIMDFIVLNPSSAVEHRQELIGQKGLDAAEEWYRNNFINLGNLWLLKDEIIIIGLAPYDRLLAQYQKVLARNHSIYITSWTDWHSGKVPYPYQENKSGFLETLANYIDGVACISRKTEEEVSFWNNVTQVVNHAIKTEEYRKKDYYNREKKYIFLGRYAEEKNIGVIIEYLNAHPEKEIEIAMAGNGPLKDIVEEHARHDNRLHLLGHLNKDEIKMILHEYDYLILPSSQEPFGIVLLEALACGVPCIVSNAQGPREIICHDKTGIIFELEDEKGFGRAMDYSMELSENQYKEMCINAIFESRKYDVNEVIKKWIMLFEKTCGKH